MKITCKLSPFDDNIFLKFQTGDIRIGAQCACNAAHVDKSLKFPEKGRQMILEAAHSPKHST